MDATQQQELIEFLRDNLKVEVSCRCDGCCATTVEVTVSLCGHQISQSHDYLPAPSSYDKCGYWPIGWPGY